MKDIILKILFYTFLAAITVICFFVILVFRITKDILLNPDNEAGKNENPHHTNIFGQDIEEAKLAHWPMEEEFPDLFK